MKTFLTLILINSFFVSNGQESLSLTNRQDTINYLINNIEKDSRVSSIGTGFAGLPSKQYYRFVFLLSMVDNNKLLDLLKNSKGCLKVYAYMGLYHNNYNLLDELKESLCNDITKLDATSGCVSYTITIAEMIDKIEAWYWKIQTDELLALINFDSEFRKREFNWLTGLED